MDGTISDGTSTITPVLIDGYASSQESKNVVHDVLGSSDPDVTIRPARLRTGSLTLVFVDEATSDAARRVFAAGGPFTLTPTVRTTIGMRFVTSGTVGRELDDTTRQIWTVTVAFQEVPS